MRLLIVLLFFTTTNQLFAQTTDRETMTFNLSEIAMLNIAPNNSTLNLNLISPSQPGEQVKFDETSNNTKWINFTSAVEGGNKRTIYIRIEDGIMPAGLNLKVNVSEYTGNGKGALGLKIESLVLNNNSQALVTDIGGAYTGYGSNNGYKLTYSLEITDYELLNMDNSEVLTISLTLTDI